MSGDVWSSEPVPGDGMTAEQRVLLAKLREHPGTWLRHLTNVNAFWSLTDQAAPLLELKRRKLLEVHVEHTVGARYNVWVRVPAPACCCDGYAMSLGGPRGPSCPVHGHAAARRQS